MARSSDQNRRPWGFLIFLAVLQAGIAHADTVTLSGGLEAWASNARSQDGGTIKMGFTTATNPLNITPPATVNGANSVTNSFDFSDAVLSIGLTHARTGVQGAFAESFGTLDFSVQPDVVGGTVGYTLSGDFGATDANGVGGTIYLNVTLTDLTTSTVLFSNFQESLHTANEAFTLGQSDGDVAPTLSGSLSGSLVAGDDYEWFYDALISRDDPTSLPDSATASGNLMLAFSDTAPAAGTPPAPLPSAAWCGLGLLAGLFFIRQRRRMGM